MAGAQFRQCDFQIHSPRDAGWDGPRPEDTLSAEAQPTQVAEARRDWARAFLSHCINHDIRAVALTDHHEGIYIWPVFDALAELRSASEDADVYVFPGMELTAKDSAQAIILFDSNIGRPLFEKARSLLGLPVETDEWSPKGIEIQLLDHNVHDLQNILASDSELRNRFIILPNVTPGGHKTVLRTGFHKRFSEMPYIGGYLDAKYPADLSLGDRRILDGEIPAWSSDRRGVITTSDNRQSDFGLLGSFSTWIKLAEPTAESLRQAMLAADSRIRYEKPILPTVVIQSIAVRGSHYLQVPDLGFSDQFNAIIGGRGAGKSTLLEYIRFALGRSAIDDTGTNSDPTQARRERLLRSVLGEDATIKLTILLNGALVKLERRLADQELIHITIGENTSTAAVHEVRNLVPVQTYSQGELSHLGSDDASHRLIDLVTGPDGPALNSLEEQSTELTQALRAASERCVRFWHLQADVRMRTNQLRSIEEQIQALQAQLAEAPTHHREAVEAHPAYQQTTEYFQYLHDEGHTGFTGLSQALTRIAETMIAPPGFDTLVQSSTTAEATSAAQTFGEAINVCLTQLQRANELFNLQLTSAAQDWVQEAQQHQHNYDTALAALHNFETVARRLEALQKRKQDISGAIRTSRSEIMALNEPESAFSNAVQAHLLNQHERLQIIATACERVEPQSGGLAKAVLSDKPQTRPITETIAALVGGTNTRENRSKALAQWVSESESPQCAWWQLMSECRDILRDKILAPLRPSPTPILSEHLGERGFERFAMVLSQGRLAEALTMSLQADIQIFQVREHAEIAFEDASQGERASTLLTLLLKQHHGPLVIDQPEEDLDNRVIVSVVQAIRESKDGRQIIAATHNANLVVNADAENVIELDNGAISATGAIDQEQVRDSITSTMEGGRESFELRRKKYNF